MQFEITGTSNATTATFTLPFSTLTTPNIALHQASGDITDNGVQLTTPGKMYMNPNSSTVNIFTNMANAAWTATGTKTAKGSFWFEASS